MWNATLALVSDGNTMKLWYIINDSIFYLSAVTLTIDDLATVVNELHEVRDKWYHLGVQLNMKPSDLDPIQKQYMNNCDDCLLQMLSLWLTKTTPSPPSWQRVVDALCSPAIGKQSAGERLKQIYIDPAPAEAQEKSEGNNNKTAILKCHL